VLAVTGGSFEMDLQAVFADDEHAVVLAMVTATRDGRRARQLEAHIHRLRDGRTVEFWTASTDPYGWDELIG
jgi:ketosteroid isomerase-like protein